MIFAISTLLSILPLLALSAPLPQVKRLAPIKRSAVYDPDAKYLVSIKQDTVDPDNRERWLNRVFSANRGTQMSVLNTENMNLKWDTRIFNGLAGKFSEEQLETLRSQDEVVYIEQDVKMSISELVRTNDNPWGVSRLANLSLKSKDPTQLNFPYISDETAGSNVDVYVLDTGVRISHDEFGGRATFLASFGLGVPDSDQNGHGTHVAGTVAGLRVGVAKNANIFAVKVFSDDGTGDTSDIISGINAAFQNSQLTGRPSVINMSLGGPPEQSLDDAVRAVIAQGIHVVLAAGNSAEDANNVSPARVEEAITVGATDINDIVANFSNFGDKVDVFAPGVAIISASFEGDNLGAVLDGTSMASPHVAGLAALILGQEGQMTPAELEQRIKDLSIKGAIQGLPAGTLDGLAFNGAIEDVPPEEFDPSQLEGFF